MCMYQSLSEEAKEIIRGYIVSGKEYERKELVNLIKSKAEQKDKMTDGVIAGAIKMLTTSNEIMVVARGIYRKGIPMKAQSMDEKVLNLFNRFKADLEKMCMVNALTLSQSDIKFIEKLNEICNNLESSIWELEDMKAGQAGDKKETGVKAEEAEPKKPEPQVIEKQAPADKKGEAGKDKKAVVVKTEPDKGKGGADKKEEKVVAK